MANPSIYNFSVTFRPTFRVREFDSDGEVGDEFNLELNDAPDRRRERSSDLTAVVLQNASPLFPFETKTLNAADVIHHIGRASGRVRGIGHPKSGLFVGLLEISKYIKQC